MKNVFKRVISVVLGVLMFLFPAQRAFARIDVVEFNDRSRLTRFAREDLQNMVDWYAFRVSGHERAVARRDADNFRVEVVCGVSALLLGLPGLPVTLIGVLNVTDYAGVLVCGLVLDMLCILCVILGCYRGYGGCSKAIPGENELGQLREIKGWLIRNKVMAGADESSHLLQSAPDCFLLLERPKYKASTDPRPFFTSDRNTTFSQNLINNRFAGLIRDVSSKLRAQGARISDRYCLTKVGNGFERVRNVPIMPEIDGVEVVVD